MLRFWKKEVLEKGLPAKREITFETPLFGSKTFLIYVEPVFSKVGETFGINYMGMDVTNQVFAFCMFQSSIKTFLLITKGYCVSSTQTTGEEKRKDGKA
ncbi:hypothetical protein ACE6H2_006597 [Prunus campanulata]